MQYQVIITDESGKTVFSSLFVNSIEEGLHVAEGISDKKHPKEGLYTVTFFCGAKERPVRQYVLI